jgi:hypothetical protein
VSNRIDHVAIDKIRRTRALWLSSLLRIKRVAPTGALKHACDLGRSLEVRVPPEMRAGDADASPADLTPGAVMQPLPQI